MHFSENYISITIDLSKQQALGDDRKTMQQNNFIWNFDLLGNKTIFFILKEVKKTIWDFHNELEEYYWVVYKFTLIWHNMNVIWLNIRV